MVKEDEFRLKVCRCCLSACQISKIRNKGEQHVNQLNPSHKSSSFSHILKWLQLHHHTIQPSPWVCLPGLSFFSDFLPLKACSIWALACWHDILHMRFFHTHGISKKITHYPSTRAGASGSLASPLFHTTEWWDGMRNGVEGNHSGRCNDSVKSRHDNR